MTPLGDYSFTHGQKPVDLCPSGCLEKTFSLAISDIFNSDQGSQFTSVTFIDKPKEEKLRINMDRKGRAMDNVFTERLWRSVKYEEVYLYDYQMVQEAKQGISRYLGFYNQKRVHQSLDYRTPAEVYCDSKNYKNRPICNLTLAN